MNQATQSLEAAALPTVPLSLVTYTAARFGEILSHLQNFKSLDNFLRVYLAFGNILQQDVQNCMLLEKFYSLMCPTYAKYAHIEWPKIS